MKTKEKKVPRNFRLNAQVEAQLRSAKDILGIDETRIVEDALRYWFSGKMREETEARLKRLERAKGFEPSTFTLAR